MQHAFSLDLAGSYLRGAQARDYLEERKRQGALRQLLAESGPQIMAGDPAALSALAQYDPAQAQRIQAGVAQQRQMGIEQRREAINNLAGAVEWADTPDKWAQVGAAAERDYGLTGWPDFSQRERMLAEARGVMEQVEPKRYNVGGALVDAQGNVVYESPEKPQAQPSAVQQYQFAREQGYQGSFMDYQNELKRAGATNVNVNTGPTGIDYGKPEAGLAWKRTPDGRVALDERGAPIAIPYEGGSVQREQEEAARKTQERRDEAVREAELVVENIDGILAGDLSFWTTGFMSSATAKVPGTPAYDMARSIETVKAIIGFNRLQAMRAASPTGGALGQVSNLENQLLQATKGSLDQAQSEAQLRANLERIRNYFLDVVHGEGNGPERSPGWKGLRAEAVDEFETLHSSDGSTYMRIDGKFYRMPDATFN